MSINTWADGPFNPSQKLNESKFTGTMTKVKSLNDADAVYCETCKLHVGKFENPAWGINKTKGLHEKGSPTHKIFYVKYDRE